MPTHWKKLTNPDYLGAYAFEPGEEKTVTIDQVRRAIVTGQEGKQEECTVAFFKEPGIKPLILNATNCKAIQKLYKTGYIEEWEGKRIILRVQPVKAFGEVVDAVRVKPEKPAAAPLCAACKKPIGHYNQMTPEKLAEYTRKKYGRALCSSCAAQAASDCAAGAEEEPLP